LLAATLALADARTLIERLAREPPASIAFTEARFSPLLREPLIVSGELAYLGPTSLDRRVTKPYRETTSIRGRTVRVEREGEKPRSFALDRAPELERLLMAFGALLAGDSAALEKDFAIAAAGDDADWSLELTPLAERARRRLRALAIFGSGTEPRCFVTFETQQGGSVLVLGAEAGQAVAPAASFDDLSSRCRAR
jgi:hypothetical protein